MHTYTEFIVRAKYLESPLQKCTLCKWIQCLWQIEWHEMVQIAHSKYTGANKVRIWHFYWTVDSRQPSNNTAKHNHYFGPLYGNVGITTSEWIVLKVFNWNIDLYFGNLSKQTINHKFSFLLDFFFVFKGKINIHDIKMLEIKFKLNGNTYGRSGTGIGIINES